MGLLHPADSIQAGLVTSDTAAIRRDQALGSALADRSRVGGIAAVRPRLGLVATATGAAIGITALLPATSAVLMQPALSLDTPIR